MNTLEKLLKSARDDTQLLKENDKNGDDFSIPRDVVFILYADSQGKANAVANFINENHYGFASIKEVDGKFRVIMMINTPATQNLIISLSGLMNCIAELFGVEYGGWNCVLQCP